MAHRFEGRNLDEALDHAAETLGVDRYQLTHSVIFEKRGFLGGVKRIVIEADVNEGAAPPAAPPPPPPVVAAAAPPVAREHAGRGPRAGAGGRGGRGGNRRDDRPRGPRREHRDDDLRPGDFEHFAAVEVPEQGPESEAAKAVREWCEEVIDYARFELDI